MVQGPKAPRNALLPRTSIVAVQHFPDHILRGRGRWKGHVKGFAAMPAVAMPRALVAIAKGCCSRAVLCMIARQETSCPRLFSEHNFECKGALERPQPHLDGGALNAAAVQSFIARASLMHTCMALHGANKHSRLPWAVSGRILARRGPLDAHERARSGGVRCAAVVLLPAEKAHCVH